jgi:hypothetical protein
MHHLLGVRLTGPSTTTAVGHRCSSDEGLRDKLIPSGRHIEEINRNGALVKL